MRLGGRGVGGYGYDFIWAWCGDIIEVEGVGNQRLELFSSSELGESFRNTTELLNGVVYLRRSQLGKSQSMQRLDDFS